MKQRIFILLLSTFIGLAFVAQAQTPKFQPGRIFLKTGEEKQGLIAGEFHLAQPKGIYFSVQETADAAYLPASSKHPTNTLLVPLFNQILGRPIMWQEFFNFVDGLKVDTVEDILYPLQLPNPGTPPASAANNDLFYLELKYDNPVAGYDIPAQSQKNGNISQLWWRVRGKSAEAWGLEYDYLNRLTQAKHVAAHDGGAKILGQYSEKISYADARGNIGAIQRYGVIPGASYPSGMIDNLSFTMKPGSNQLQRVADAAPPEFAPRGFKPSAGAQNIDYTYDLSITHKTSK
ncbi:hypothetical protein [Haliscomenobacter hydrossis]|uniref:hypothetical protein n=1 Tax=Haliscomenobacter hydrossis TaxID=2350 RepID=UPI0005C6B106|nr:hypothetical protein [Haliscomenobacter hydrossis]